MSVLWDIKKVTSRVRRFTHLSLANLLLLLIGIGAVTYGGHRLFQLQTQHTVAQNELTKELFYVRQNIEAVSTPAVLQKIIREKLPTLSPDVQCAVTDMTYRTALFRGVPLPIALAIPDNETLDRTTGGWDVNATSEAGAMGQYQVMPVCARPYMNFALGGFSHERLKDPVRNAFCGINIIADWYEECGDWAQAVAHYNSGYVINDRSRSYSQRVMARAKEYELRFATPMKEFNR